MTVRDTLVGDDDVAVTVVVSDQVFDPDLAGDGTTAGGADWIPVVSIPADAAPLKLWIRTPERRSADPATAGNGPAPAHGPAASWRLERPSKGRFVLRNTGTAVVTGVTVDHAGLGAATRNVPRNATVPPGASVEFTIITGFGAPAPNEIYVSWDGAAGPVPIPVPAA